VHGHIVSDDTRVLSAVGQQRKSEQRQATPYTHPTPILFSFVLGQFEYFDSTLVDRVLPAVGRNHSAHVVGRSAFGQVRVIHDDTRHTQVNEPRKDRA